MLPGAGCASVARALLDRAAIRSRPDGVADDLAHRAEIAQDRHPAPSDSPRSPHRARIGFDHGELHFRSRQCPQGAAPPALRARGARDARDSAHPSAVGLRVGHRRRRGRAPALPGGARAARRRHPAGLAGDHGCRTRHRARARPRCRAQVGLARVPADPPGAGARRHARVRRREPLRHPRRIRRPALARHPAEEAAPRLARRAARLVPARITGWCAPLVARAYRFAGRGISLFPVASELVAPRIASAFGVPRDRIVVTGDPRDDAAARRRRAARERPRRSRRGPRRILYAPTWRDGASGPGRPDAATWDAIAAWLERTDAELYVRTHPLGKGDYAAGPTLSPRGPDAGRRDGVLDVTPELAAFDALITDYSSIAFDFVAGRRRRSCSSPPTSRGTPRRAACTSRTATSAAGGMSPAGSTRSPCSRNGSATASSPSSRGRTRPGCGTSTSTSPTGRAPAGCSTRSSPAPGARRARARRPLARPVVVPCRGERDAR